MLVVTGTKRSGTSMWMQILGAGGFPVFGEAHPPQWARIRSANPGGFFESSLREGVHHGTNPHPHTGHYIPPDEARGLAVKVFVPGLLRTDPAFIDRVLGTVRPCSEYVASMARLRHLETQVNPSDPAAEHRRAALRWWAENYALIVDAVTRRYPIHLVSYATVLRSPHDTIAHVFEWLGGGDVPAAVGVVDPSAQTQHDAAVPIELPPAILETFHALYRHVDEARPMAGSFLEHLNETNRQLRPLMRTTLGGAEGATSDASDA